MLPYKFTLQAAFKGQATLKIFGLYNYRVLKN